MHIVTGGAGFIGSAVVWRLNQAGIDEIIVVDRLGSDEKWKNLRGLKFADYVDQDDFLQIIQKDDLWVHPSAIVHMGACSSTTERNADFLMRNNFAYSQALARWSMKNKVRFIYASSAATYGDGEAGFSDSDENTRKLLPQNIYGYSKQLFDLWALASGASEKICGLKFFNVFGPNEYHKGDMSSVVFKAFHQVKSTGVIRLFKSYRKGIEDGKQTRDFVYVKDCMESILWLLDHPETNGIYNLGTGRARTWLDLANAIFRAMKVEPKIEFIDMPEAIRDRYQYATEAKMEKLEATGCPLASRTLEKAVEDYVATHLQAENPFLSR